MPVHPSVNVEQRLRRCRELSALVADVFMLQSQVGVLPEAPRLSAAACSALEDLCRELEVELTGLAKRLPIDILDDEKWPFGNGISAIGRASR